MSICFRSWCPVLCFVTIALSACWSLPESPYRQALPDDATEVLEHRSGTVDFVYLLRARVTRGGFEAYVAELGLSLVGVAAKPDETARTVSPQPADDEPDWWRPFGPADEVFHAQLDGDEISAKYSQGFLYLSVVHL